MQGYIQGIKGLSNPSFDQIRRLANTSISHLSDLQRHSLWQQLGRGEAVLDSHEQMCQYLFSYGKMHKAKLDDVFGHLPDSIFLGPYEVIDWGCGQGMGVINLFDYLKNKGIGGGVSHVTLIEPSLLALDRAILHVKSYLPGKEVVSGINCYFEAVNKNQIESKSGLPVVHIFSNILDVPQIDLKYLASLVDSAVVSDNYIVCVGPLNPNNRRIDAFYSYFNVPLLYSKESSQFAGKNWTYKGRLYKLEPKKAGNLIPIEYYPSVQFHAAYELDSFRVARLASKINLFESLCSFEVAAPFDIGASVYADVHPIFAVLNNIVTRGLPTKASLYLEGIFMDSFHNTTKVENLGEIFFQSASLIDLTEINLKIKETQASPGMFTAASIVPFQELLTPIAIARFQKVIIEAIITGHLDLKKDEWQVLAIENDVPFAALALKDFADILYHLTQLSDDYSGVRFPIIFLDVIAPMEFIQSPLHLDANVCTSPDSTHYNKKYDLVIDLAMLTENKIEKDTFSKFNCINDCYFNIRSAASIRTSRTIYTSALIKYKKLVEKNAQGGFIENDENRRHLEYFLRLIFRKDRFRPGQLPILDRATQNLPVIGLLPTGGGKSLTYQLAALLQPGVTLVVDPLKALMKDQYDGLVNNGIDCCTYISSSFTIAEREKKERQMESSNLLIVFVSPERLSVLKFRERLKHMHDYNVYFSYGVIDEVHCVSEWGHDFRFSYLHLGRNLYNFVKAKDGAISLLGLTATASFDVLADVERELTTNGSFILDSDAIVRYENTNRLELQYKIEPVEVHFATDRSYDPKMLMDINLPRAIDVQNNHAIYDCKSIFLEKYLTKIPGFLQELQIPQNSTLIKSRFAERQNIDDNLDIDLSVEIPTKFFEKQAEYKSAGIVFCPHVDNTGLSVQINKANISRTCQDVGSYSGRDDNGSMVNLELFRENKQPIMVATKAFGMGIDKPNVRFTVNLNYSSSLESFVQEAGRAGRDRKMALSMILVSKYEVAKVRNNYEDTSFPLPVIKEKWFNKNDLDTILSHYKIDIPPEYVDIATPSKDMVKVFCKTNTDMFISNSCDASCSEFKICKIRQIPLENRGWQVESYLLSTLTRQNLKISKKYFQYLSADYEAVMFFFNSSFKGDIVEKRFLQDLLNVNKVLVSYEKPGNELIENLERTEKNGFLETLISSHVDQKIIVFIPYVKNNQGDIAKAIYRMCCIDLIEDFTQDYSNSEYRIIIVKKEAGKYFTGLKNFLLRYYTNDRADLELNKAINYPIRSMVADSIEAEIYCCLAFVTDFVYDKISEKRKRAIDDMRNFCIEGTDTSKSWIERNENLKDYIYYYFNSKYAKSDYVTESGEPYSLTEDTENGKRSDPDVVIKYLNVIEDDLVGSGTPNDNVKHLQGAIRLLMRSLTDSNPSLSLLNVFVLSYLGTKGNKNLELELVKSYQDGMIEMATRLNYSDQFWELFCVFNKKVDGHIVRSKLQLPTGEVKLAIHGMRLNNIVEKYTRIYE